MTWECERSDRTDVLVRGTGKQKVTGERERSDRTDVLVRGTGEHKTGE